MKSRASLFVWFLTVFLFGGAAVANAQTASLGGVVTDPTDASVPGATITATHVERQQTFQTVSDEAGRYLIRNLPVGTFTIQVAAAGFKVSTQTGVDLTVDIRAALNITLDVGDVSESVVVTAETSRVDLQSATIQQLIDSRRVLDLPLNGRDVYQLAKLVPGTGGTGFNINGARGGTEATTTNVRLDGAQNVESNSLNVLPSPPPDAVQEFTIQTSIPSAKYAFSAGVIEIVTKSGTNELHGAAYDFFRNDALDARNFFSPTKTKRRRNQFGGAIGGPLWLPGLYDGRNRTFWFVSLEKQLEPLGRVATIFTPTAQQAGGDFSGLGTTVRDPLTNEPFPGNVVPASRLDRVATNVLDQFVPISSESNGRYVYQQPADNNPIQVLARGDHTIGSNLFSFRTYSFRRTAPYAYGNLPYFGNATSKFRTDNQTFSHTRFISPTASNVLRLSYNAYANGRDSDYGQFPIDKLQALGWSDNFYNYTNFVPRMNVRGFFDVSATLPVQDKTSDTFFLEDDLSLNRGRHMLGVGFRIVRAYQLDDLIVRSMGSYDYNGQFTGSALTDFMLGKPFFFEQQNEQRARERQTTVAGYIQDDIKWSARLSINLGLRYEIPFAPVDRDGYVTVFQPGSTVQSNRFVNAPPGLLFRGDAGVGTSGRATQWTQFSPRIGFAYALTQDQKTVLRGGYGYLHNPSFLNLEGQYTNKQPWVNRISVRPPASTDDPWRDFPDGNPFPSPSGNPDFVFRNAQIFSYAPNFVEPAMQQWNVNVQREVAQDFLFSAAYVGSRGTHLMVLTDYNAATYIEGQSTPANLDARRPFYAPLTIIEWAESGGNSSYHSAQFSLDKRFSRGFSVLGSYTYSKSLDMQSFGWNPYPQNNADYGGEWGPSAYDRTHAFTSSWVWQIPGLDAAAPLVRHVVGGWQLTGILSLYSGTPLAMTTSQDRALRGLTNRPDRLRDARLSDDRSRGEQVAQYFDTTAYRPNQAGQFGSAPRTESQLRAPGTINLDFGIMKSFPLAERHRLDFRVEIFNLPNRPNFISSLDRGDAIGTNVDSAGSFGRILAAADGRIIQLGVKYVF